MILINEILPNPNGYDTGYEWIELINTGDTEIDISGWKIEIAGTYFKGIYTFPSLSKFPAQSLLTICESKVEQCSTYTTIGMHNGGDSTDGVRIINTDGIVQDVLLYEKNNINLLQGITGTVALDKDIVSNPQSGCSLSRIKDYFIETCTPSFNQENQKEDFTKKIQISEVGYGWLEYRFTNQQIDINGWNLIIDETSIPLSNSNIIVIPTTAKHIDLMSPDLLQQDEFSVETLSPNYSYCRLESEVFQICSNTKDSENITFSPSPVKVLPNLEGLQILNGCAVYADDKNNLVFSDGEFAVPIQCQDCKTNQCYTLELDFNSNTVTKLFSEKEIDKKQNYIHTINGHLDTYLHKIVTLSGIPKNSIIPTKYGDIIIENPLDNSKSYTLQGILVKQNNLYYLNYLKTLIIQTSDSRSLEDTGDPLLPLFLSFIILGYFVKLLGIKLFTYMYGRSKSL